MISQINNPKKFLFVTDDNSSEHNSVPIDQLWGEAAYMYVPKQQKNAKPTPKTNSTRI